MTTSLPALLGGSPVRPSGPPSWPFPDDAVRDALFATYSDGSWGKYHGLHVDSLERQLTEYHGVEFALPCGSGTFAVELALRALQIGPGDEVILVAYDYPGNFLTIHAVGAHPVLVDVAPHNWNLSPDALTEAISPATKAVIVSHLHGGFVPMADVADYAKSRGVAVIEDACQCPGSLIDGRKAGTWGDVGVLSFGGSKTLTAGRGGALLTNRPDLHQRARTYQLRGNLVCPLSELQAAVLLPQMLKLDDGNTKRVHAVSQLLSLIREVPGIEPLRNNSGESVPGYYKLGFKFDENAFGLDRASFVAAMRAEGIAFDEGFRSAHVGRSAKRFRQVGKLTEAGHADQRMVILHHPVLLAGDSAITEVAQAVGKVHRHAEAIRQRMQGTLP